MNVNLKLTTACVFGGMMALATSVWAIPSAPPVAATATPSSTLDATGDNSNPYAVIVDRNVFRLNPPPPPPAPQEKPKELPKVYLSGIIKIGDDVRVLFSIPPKDAKSQTSYFKLAPGEKDGDLELVKIHPDQQNVDVLVSGTAMTLSMLSNTLASAGAKAASGAAAPAPGARPGPAGRAGLAAPPAPATASATRESSAIVVGGGSRDSSTYGGTTVAGGGGGVTTIGGGNSSSFGGGAGVSVAGGNSSFGGGGVGATPFGGGTTVSGGLSSAYGGGTTVAGGAGTSAAAQVGNLLAAGPQGSAQVSNLQQPGLSGEQQALEMAAFAAEHPNGPPLPPPVQAQVDGVPYNPHPK
jgi:hypothetical protein